MAQQETSGDRCEEQQGAADEVRVSDHSQDVIMLVGNARDGKSYLFAVKCDHVIERSYDVAALLNNGIAGLDTIGAWPADFVSISTGRGVNKIALKIVDLNCVGLGNGNT